MAVKRWKTSETGEEKVRKFTQALGVSSLTAKTLISRGYTDPENVPVIGDGCCCEDPFVLKDMDLAVDRILRALDRDELIAVFGDYDVDGLTATTLAYRCLVSLGARVVCSLPSRDDTGYGLSNEAIDNLAEAGVTLIVTVDNGVSAFAEVEYASSLGIDTVVTDHHVVRAQMPKAVAVVNPHRADDTSLFKELAGVGVALKLAAALEGVSVSQAVEEYGLLAAIGTIADIMPLCDENRFIVRKGLSQFALCDITGLCALCEKTGLNPAEANEQDVSYTISPHLNAAGRMGNAELALELLLTEDEEKAAQLADELIHTNDMRREEEQRSVAVINSILADNPRLISAPVIIVAGSGFHSGVMGIVCSRLVEQYNKPVVVISTEDGEAKGSGRSVDGISLYEIIEQCSDIMGKFGGHEMAAGFTMSADKIDEFRKRVTEYCKGLGDNYVLPSIQVDGIVSGGEVNEQAVENLRVMAPFGSANKEPCFMVENAVLAGVYRLGSGKNTRLMLKKGSETFYAAYFGCDPDNFPYSIGEKLDAVLTYSIYTGHSKNIISVKTVDVRRSGVSEKDMSTYEQYRRYLLCGNVPADADLLITRADVAAVYKQIRDGSVFADDMALAGEIPGQPLGRAVAARDILLSLGLIETVSAGERRTLSVVQGAAKRDLKESVTFRDLNREN